MTWFDCVTLAAHNEKCSCSIWPKAFFGQFNCLSDADVVYEFWIVR